MNIEGAFPSKFLKASDLGGQNVNVKIDRVEMDTVGDDTRAILYFIGKEKGLVLNVTNKNEVVTLYGHETDEWHGQPIILYVAMVQFQSKMVQAIRVMAPPRQGRANITTGPQPTRTTNAVAGDPRSDADMNDEVPF